MVQSLNDHAVSYIVVGGVAVVLHGYARLTVDIDLVIALNQENAIRAIMALTSIGLVPRIPVNPLDFADESIRESWRTEKHALVFTMIDPSNPFFGVDLFIEPPISYEVLDQSAEVKDMAGIPVRVCSLDALRRMKQSSGRAKDLADLEGLDNLQQ